MKIALTLRTPLTGSSGTSGVPGSHPGVPGIVLAHSGYFFLSLFFLFSFFFKKKFLLLFNSQWLFQYLLAAATCD